MKYILALSIICYVFNIAYADEATTCKNAISTHLNEAILHNKKNAPLYAKVSNNKSLVISKLLINGERFSYLLVQDLEYDALIYQNNGIRLLCDDLISMSEVPTFKELTPIEARPVKYIDLNIKVLKKEIKEYLKRDDLHGLYLMLDEVLEEMKSFPNQHCMTRHFLESMARTLFLFPAQKKAALDIGLEDPTSLVKRYLKLQTMALTLDHYLDQKAFPLQKEGFPILCGDVPAIKWK